MYDISFVADIVVYAGTTWNYVLGSCSASLVNNYDDGTCVKYVVVLLGSMIHAELKDSMFSFCPVRFGNGISDITNHCLVSLFIYKR